MTVNRIENDIKRRNLVLGGGLSFILWNLVRSNVRKVRTCKIGDSVRSIVFVRALWSRCAVRLERHPIDWNGEEFLFGGQKKGGESSSSFFPFCYGAKHSSTSFSFSSDYK